MDPIEQRVRESLRARAGDAEPTPQLYRGVQDRIAKRRRAKLLAWVPAGAAALGVAVAVPMLLTDEPGVPNIEDYADEQPASSATTADRVVLLDRTGELSVLDLTDASSTQPYDGLEIGGMLPEIDVAPSDRSDVPVVHTATVEDRPEGEVLRLGYRTRDGGAIEVSGSSAIAAGGLTVSPDGRWVATLGPMEDAGDWVLQLRPSRDTSRTAGPAAPAIGERPAALEPGIVVPSGSVLQDWSGSLDPVGGVSQVTVVTPDGLLLGFPLTAGDGAFTWEEERIERPVGEREVAAYASSHLGDETGFVLETVGDATVVQAVDGEQVLGQVDVSDLVGSQDPSTFALDAWGDTAALSTPGDSWLLPHDGEGQFTERVALPEGTVRAALVGRSEVVAAPDEPEEPAPAEDPAEEETPPGEEPTVHPGEGDLLDEGMVVTDDRTVTLVRPDGSTQELVTFPTEGESTVVGVAVRPGSTAEDLTVAITTRAEGTFDVRWLRVVGGTVDDTIAPDFPAPPIERDGEVVFASPDLQDGGAPAAVWSPDGDLLAVVSRPEPGAAAEVRTIGWSEDGPSDDPNLAASFELDTDRPLTARQWVWTDDADGVARAGELLLVDELAREAFSVRLDRQGDGAPAMPADNPLEPVEGEGVLDVADLDRDGTVDAVLRVGDPVPVLELRDGGASVPLEFTGPREANFLAGSPESILVVLDPAQPVLVDPTTGEPRPFPFDGEVVAADLIR